MQSRRRGALTHAPSFPPVCIRLGMAAAINHVSVRSQIKGLLSGHTGLSFMNKAPLSKYTMPFYIHYNYDCFSRAHQTASEFRGSTTNYYLENSWPFCLSSNTFFPLSNNSTRREHFQDNKHTTERASEHQTRDTQERCHHCISTVCISCQHDNLSIYRLDELRKHHGGTVRVTDTHDH